MRHKDEKLLTAIKKYVEEFCDNYGYGPTVRAVAATMNISPDCANRYMKALTDRKEISYGRKGYESNAFSVSKSMKTVAILGAVPCGPLTEVEELIEGYVRLPESFVGQGKFFILRASGNSMIGAGINDGDMVLIRQQETANVGDIIVALVENEVTLKRLNKDADGTFYLHPENRRMKDIYADEIQTQGVAIKVIKDLGRVDISDSVNTP